MFLFRLRLAYFEFRLNWGEMW